MYARRNRLRKKSASIRIIRRPHPRARLACGFLAAILIHVGVFRLPLPAMEELADFFPPDFFPQPAPQLSMIELTLEDSAPLSEKTEEVHSDEIQQLQNFRTTVVERTAVLEQTLLTALGQQAEASAARQQQEMALEAARADLSQQVTDLSAERAELAAQLAAEQQRRAELERQLQAQVRAKEEEISGVKGAYDRLVAALKGEISQKEIALHQVKEKLVVTILDRVLFPSGQATLTPEGQRVIEKVGAILAKVNDRRILIEGHTDNVPIGPVLSTQFPTNWELSTARATEVVKYLIAAAKLSPQLLSAVGRADTVPAANNENEEGRRQNRRIEIILLPPEDLLHSVASS